MSEEQEKTPLPFWRRVWVKRVVFIGVGILGVYAMIFRDVVSRAKAAYLQGEQYLAWHAKPEEKKKFFDAKAQKEKESLQALFRKGDISEQEYRLKLDTVEFDKNFRISESSLKYAYQWFKDTYELFSPPESKWVRQARAKAPDVLEQWKQELREKKIPFEDYMFE